MWLVLCSRHDTAARWAYEGLQARGLAPLELVTIEDLVYGPYWEHRLGRDGVSSQNILSDLRTLQSREVKGALNRLTYLPPSYLSIGRPEDRDYAAQELNALLLSWLQALAPPILNPPTPQGLSGRWRHLSEWVCLAARAGLPTSTYHLNSYDFALHERRAPHEPVQTVITLAGQTFGASAPNDILEGCLRLSESSDTPLLGVEFVGGESGQWTFADSTPLPDLRLGRVALLDALAGVLGVQSGAEL
jgi:hypothetical protein